MKRILFALMLFASYTNVTVAQVQYGGFANMPGSGTLTASDAVVGAPDGVGTLISGASTAGSVVYVVAPSAYQSWTLQITGYTSGTVYTEGSMNSTNGYDGTWVDVKGRRTGTAPGTEAVTYAQTSNGIYRGNIAGFSMLRARLIGGTGVSILFTISYGAGAVFLNSGIPSGSSIIGKVGIDQTTPGTTNLVSLGSATVNVSNGQTQPVTDAQLRASAVPVSLAVNTPVIATGTNTIGAVNIAAGQTLGTVTTVGAVTAITNALPTGTNKIGTVDIATAAATAKGTQGANYVPTQDAKDAGRVPVHYYMLIPVLATATDVLQSLTGTKSGSTVTATTTPAVVTTGKTFRVTRIAATYIATATSGYGVVRLRYNTGGVVAITSPVAATLAVGTSNPATANAADTEEAILPDGWEFAAGTGIGISVQGFSAATATAVGYILVSVTGYEY